MNAEANHVRIHRVFDDIVGLDKVWSVVFAGDVAWVAGSILVLALPATWTMAGFVGIVVVALIVADFAILEYLGLRRVSGDTLRTAN